jgi:hypothetical protein
MKFNLKNFYFRNKQVLLFLGALFLGVMIFISFYKIKEGFDNSSIGEYAYLKPVPANNTWSQATQDAFLPIYTKSFKDSGYSGNAPTIADIMKDATEEEGKYYISNSKFPWGSYITNAYTSAVKKSLAGSDAANNPETIAHFSAEAPTVRSTRTAYKAVYELLDESKQTPTPLSYQIYMGTSQPPAAPSTTSSTPSPSSLSTADYQSLTSICKNVLPANTA